MFIFPYQLQNNYCPLIDWLNKAGLEGENILDKCPTALKQQTYSSSIFFYASSSPKFTMKNHQRISRRNKHIEKVRTQNQGREKSKT